VLKTVAKHEDPNARAGVLSSYYMPRAIYETKSPSRTLISAVYVFAPEVPKGRADKAAWIVYGIWTENPVLLYSHKESDEVLVFSPPVSEMDQQALKQICADISVVTGAKMKKLTIDTVCMPAIM
jgi:hypothetical protein